MLKGKKAVFFDLDGTLMDSMWIWTDIDIEYLKKYNITLPDDLQSSIEGLSFSETAVYMKERFQIPESVPDMLNTWNNMAFDKYKFDVKLKPGALQFLEYLKANGYYIAITSSNSHTLIDACLQGNGVADYIDFILTGDDIQKSKPAPDIYISAAEKFQLDPEQCLVFEDVPMGILAGKNAGMKVCAVHDEFSVPQLDRIKSMADYFITSYMQVLDGSFERL